MSQTATVTPSAKHRIALQALANGEDDPSDPAPGPAAFYVEISAEEFQKNVVGALSVLGTKTHRAVTATRTIATEQISQRTIVVDLAGKVGEWSQRQADAQAALLLALGQVAAHDKWIGRRNAVAAGVVLAIGYAMGYVSFLLKVPGIGH